MAKPSKVAPTEGLLGPIVPKNPVPAEEPPKTVTTVITIVQHRSWRIDFDSALPFLRKPDGSQSVLCSTFTHVDSLLQEIGIQSFNGKRIRVTVEEIE